MRCEKPSDCGKCPAGGPKNGKRGGLLKNFQGEFIKILTPAVKPSGAKWRKKNRRGYTASEDDLTSNRRDGAAARALGRRRRQKKTI